MFTSIFATRRDNAVICFPVHNKKSEALLFKPGDCQVEIPLGALDLNSGKYSFGLGVRDADSAIVMVHAEGLSPFGIYAETSYMGKIVRPTEVVPVPEIGGEAGSDEERMTHHEDAQTVHSRVQGEGRA